MRKTLYREFATYDALDAEYAIERSVEDFDGYLESYARRSADVRSRLPFSEVSYGPTRAETFDIFPASVVRLAPVVVFIHGGYWYQGSKTDFSFMAEGLVSSGISAVIEDYELCPTVSMTEIVRQHRALIAYLYRNAGELGIDRDHIYVAGHSAGGHGAAAVLATDWSYYGLPNDVVRAGICISGLYDLRPIPFTFVGPHVQLTGTETVELSPMLDVPDSLPPLLIAYGTKETSEFQRQSVDFELACRSNGLDTMLMPLNRDHYDIIDALADGEGVLCEWVRSWATSSDPRIVSGNQELRYSR
ncbi:alpha/beta hydrolase [Rhodococcus sp. NPDC055024]